MEPNNARWKSLEAIAAAASAMVRPAEDLTVSEWAEKYRYINNPGSYVGYWNNKVAPYLIEPMDTMASTDHTAVVLAGPARSGKSDIWFNWHGHTAQCDPKDMTIFTMSNFWGKDWSQSDLEKVYRAKPPKTKRSVFERMLMPGKQNRTTYRVRFMSGMRLRVSWPAITEMSGKTIPYVALNDYDHMEQDVAKMGNPFDLGKKRTANYGMFGMTFAESTPGFPVTEPNFIANTNHEAPPVEDGILKIYNRGDRRRWYWRCPDPDCRESFEPDFDLFDYDMDAGTPAQIAKTVVMVCPCCGYRITQDMRDQIHAAYPEECRWIKDGQHWNADGTVTGEAEENEIASFWLKGPAAFMQNWAEMVTKFLNAMREYDSTGTITGLKSTMELDQGKPFVPPRNEMARLPEELKGRAEDWGSMQEAPTVPPWVRFLIATVDVQTRSFVVQVTGVGPGNDITLVDAFKITKSNRIDENDRRKEHAIIDPGGYLEDWDLLIDEVIERSYPLADNSGRFMTIKATGCDSGGRAGVTPNAYNFWRRLKNDDEGRGHHRRFHLIKGEPSKTAPRRQRRYPDSNRRDRNSGARGDVPVEFLNSNLMKDQVFGILGREVPGGGMMRFPHWAPNWVYKQLTAEERTDKGWENKSQRRNETFDLTYYAIGLGLMQEIRLEHLTWDDESRLPAWARPWDENPMIVTKETKNPFVETKQPLDISKIASEMA